MRRLSGLMLWIYLGLFLSVSSAWAEDIRLAVAARLSRTDREALGRLAIMQPAALAQLESLTRPERLQAKLEEMQREQHWALSFREADATGPLTWIHAALADVEGLRWSGAFQQQIPVPIDQGSRLEIQGSVIDLSPFWPNGMVPNMTPAEGLRGPLVDVGDGRWEALKGKALDGAIILMDFKGVRNWNRVFQLGAQAVIVVGDNYMNRNNAERFFSNTPMPCPRYFVDAATGARLREMLAADPLPQVRLSGGSLHEMRLAESRFVYLPADPILEITIRPSDLLDRIAAEFEISSNRLRELNELTGFELAVGQSLLIPGQEASYVVKEEDLLKRLSREKGIEIEALKSANPDLDPALPAGTVLKIPALDKPVVMWVRIDAVSAIPGRMHGAHAMANTLAAVEVIRHAADMPEGSRRRGLIVGFLEGDTYGGRVSRGFLESYLDATGQIQDSLIASQGGLDDVTLLARYRELGEGFASGDFGSLKGETVLWFLEEWFQNIFTQYRIQVAEARVASVLAAQQSDDQAQKDSHKENVARMDAKIDEIIAFRKAVLENKELDPNQKLQKVMEGLGEVMWSMDGGVEGWTPDTLRARFLSERDAEGLRQNIAIANQEVVRNVLTWMHADGIPNIKQPVKGFWLDLSTGSSTLEMMPVNKDYRQVTPFNAKVLNAMVEQFDRAQAAASLQAGWQNPWSFVGNNIEAVFPMQDVMSAPSYVDFWAHLGLGLVTLRAANDARPLVDTPLDTVGNLNLEAYAELLRSVLLLNGLDLQDSRSGAFPAALNVGLFSRLVGTTTKFNIRSGIDARDPVAFTLVSYPSIGKKVAGSQSKAWGGHNTATFMGNRIGVQVFSLINGRFSLPMELMNFSGLTDVYAYQQDPASGLFSYVFDGGQIGTQIQSQSFSFLPGQDTFKNLILYPLVPYVVSMGVEPLKYSMPTAASQLPSIQDAVMKGRPRHVNLEHPRIHFGESELSGMIVYMEPGRRMTLIDKRAGAVRGLLLGDLPEDDLSNLTGEGLLIGPAEGDRNLVLPLGAYHVAKSMYDISARRVAIYENFGIRDQALSQTIEISRRKIAEAETFIEAQDWKAAIGRSREAWGMLVKSYPTMLKLGREAVLSVVILMALLVPTSVFIERLLIGSKTMIARLGGTVVLFSLGTLFLNFFHPAFQIATSPFIVVIAFAMILMASMVLGICYQRFEILVRRARIAGGEAESEEISFASTLSTAFSLGVSNLKKRPTRTLLTAFTVTVLTFSIVSFVSIKGQDQLYMRPIALDSSVGGEKLSLESIESVSYNGALFRNFSWAPLSIDFIEAVETEFGSQFPVARRMSFIEVAGGNNANREGVNQIEITFQDRKAIATALMGFEAQEKSFSGLNRAVSGGNWFRSQAEAAVYGENEDRFHIILPRRIAESLGLEVSDILTEDGQRLPEAELPTVEMMGNRWKVMGIMDTDQADRIRDVNGKSLALVDYVKSAITPNMGGHLEAEDEHTHMRWQDLVLLPVTARHDVGADWLSLAVKFPADFDFETFRDEMARRMDSALYANIDGELSMLSARKQRSVGGLAKIIVPVLLCILIVSNTMMGTIEERVGEVKMLGAIGLSPSQISFLLLAESTVFSCIGIIFGTFFGLLFSKGVSLYGGAMGQLSFNFTSLSSTALAMGTGGIVLLATLIPAKKAAAMAAPSGMEKWELPAQDADGAIDFTLPFTLTAGNAVGMVAFFRRFLLNHIDSSSKDFICKNPLVSTDTEGNRLIRARLWLAPYDLDVSQNLGLYIQPAATEGVYTVRIHLHRQSGTEDAWMRTNYQFLNLVRKQFLLWRNLKSALRVRYIEEGQELLAKGDAV